MTYLITAETEVLGRVIAPLAGTMEKALAEAILTMEFPSEDVKRMNQLAEKNRSSEISDAERKELEIYSRAGGFLDLLQSKARQSLSNQ